jgi:hypothetical protein
MRKLRKWIFSDVALHILIHAQKLECFTLKKIRFQVNEDAKLLICAYMRSEFLNETRAPILVNQQRTNGDDDLRWN